MPKKPKKKESVVIMCPPLCDYPEPPSDHSKSTLVDCPECQQKMWLSEKKQVVIQCSEKFDKDILLQCYPCIMKLAAELQKQECELEVNPIYI